MNSTTCALPTLAFDHDAAQAAAESWGCNCGPSALAAILGKTLDDVRHACEAAGFAERRYMSPTMMAKAVPLAGGRIVSRNEGHHNFARHGLNRIQWTGPWTAPGANPKWAYRQTHWVASWDCVEATIIFDINGGLLVRDEWEARIVPEILKECVPRNDGGWFVANKWEVANG